MFGFYNGKNYFILAIELDIGITGVEFLLTAATVITMFLSAVQQHATVCCMIFQ